MPLPRLAVALLGTLVALPAISDEDGSGPAPAPAPAHPLVTLDVSLGLGTGNSTGQSEPQWTAGIHLSGRPGPVVLAGGLEGATNVFGSGHTFATLGAGAWFQVGRGRMVLVGLVGRHSFELFDFMGEPEEHDLPIAGTRASWELPLGRRLEARLGFAASCYVDLERERDSLAGEDVGGVTVLLSGTLGLGV